ncbi:hypothetical protein CDAR_416541 [Caerostris darwini]|uniref:Uncharacterized protein n=1 Tax=Caerostris darwini TaxID=1538125 RepID=A0AAV4MJF6_9ARAC|nr:hypothetical protein CDAR_416541 [Caerostris darwini]
MWTRCCCLLSYWSTEGGKGWSRGNHTVGKRVTIGCHIIINIPRERFGDGFYLGPPTPRSRMHLGDILSLDSHQVRKGVKGLGPCREEWRREREG